MTTEEKTGFTATSVIVTLPETKAKLKWVHTWNRVNIG